MLNRLSMAALLLFTASHSSAETPADFLRQFQAEAKQADPRLSVFPASAASCFSMRLTVMIGVVLLAIPLILYKQVSTSAPVSVSTPWRQP